MNSWFIFILVFYNNEKLILNIYANGNITVPEYYGYADAIYEKTIYENRFSENEKEFLVIATQFVGPKVGGTGARHVFACFDEPNLKSAFRFSFDLPHQDFEGEF